MNVPSRKEPESIETESNPAEAHKARQVRRMFGQIAGRYDLLNHVLSGNVDRHWRRVCLREVRRRCQVPSPRILDMGCGTGDLTIVFSELGPVVGCDFCHPMLMVGNEKISRRSPRHGVVLIEGDALRLPFSDESFDVVVSAFVLRNLADINAGLAEVRRVLRVGGIAGILDFGMPKAPVLAPAYRFYFTRILPRIGRLLSGVDGPYSYLPQSVEEFPSAEELSRRLSEVGFGAPEVKRLTGGIAVLLLARA